MTANRSNQAEEIANICSHLEPVGDCTALQMTHKSLRKRKSN